MEPELPRDKKSLYQSLASTRHIRLLRLKDWPPKQKYLSYTLETYLLDDEKTPKYYALSYTWDNARLIEPEDDEEKKPAIEPDKDALKIFCNGGALTVTQNLFDALSEFASDRHRDIDDFFWIDAICINQNDFQERSSQVTMMGEIFSKAKMVIIWLGKDMTFLDDFVWLHEHQPMWEAALTAIESGNDADSALVLRHGGPEGEQDPDEMINRWLSYSRFYKQQRFFRRAWVMQEVAIARDIMVLCGTQTLSWDTMSVLAHLLREAGFSLAITEDDPTGLEVPRLQGAGVPLGDHINRMGHLRDTCSEGEKEAGAPAIGELRYVNGAITPQERFYAYIHWLILWIRDYEATDLRDKIYSVLALARIWQPDDLDFPIIPDYKRSVVDVFIDAASFSVRNLPLLSVLSMVEDVRERRTKGLPSWVPDYAYNSPMTQINRVCSSNGMDWSKVVQATTTPPRIVGKQLHLQGAFVNTVTILGPVKHDQLLKEFYHPTIFTWVNEVFKFLLKLKRFYFTGDDRLHVLWKTLMVYTTPQEPKSFPSNDAEQMSLSFRIWLVEYMTLPYDMMSDWLQIATENLELIQKIVQNTKPPFWYEIQGDIAKYVPIQLIRHYNQQDKPIPLGPGRIYHTDSDDERFELALKQRRERQNQEKTGDETAITEELQEMDIKNKDRMKEAQEHEVEDEDGDEKELTTIDLTEYFDVPDKEAIATGYTELTRLGEPYSSASSAALDRRLFATRKGLVGLGPERMETGDEIWWVENAAVPFVLRSKNEKTAEGIPMYELVGECYICGLMEGELLDVRKGHRGPTRPIVLI